MYICSWHLCCPREKKAAGGFYIMGIYLIEAIVFLQHPDAPGYVTMQWKSMVAYVPKTYLSSHCWALSSSGTDSTVLSASVAETDMPQQNHQWRFRIGINQTEPIGAGAAQYLSHSLVTCQAYSLSHTHTGSLRPPIGCRAGRESSCEGKKLSAYRSSYRGLKVSPRDRSPVCEPNFSHLLRWADVPWLNDSGTVYPLAFFCR